VNYSQTSRHQWPIFPVLLVFLVLSSCSNSEQPTATSNSTSPSATSASTPSPSGAMSLSKTQDTGMKPKEDMSMGMKPKGTKCAADEPIKATITNGQKIYYKLGSKGYTEIKPELCFSTVAGAEKDGYQASK